MVSFTELPRFCYEFQASLSATVCYCLKAVQPLSLHFTVGWFCFCGFYFYDNAWIKGKLSLFFRSIKSTLMPTFIIINQQFYRTTLFTPYYWWKSWWRRVPLPNCVKTQKNLRNIINSSFGFYVLFILWAWKGGGGGLGWICWTVSVPDGVFTKLLRPCNLFNAQLGSRPAHTNLSKVKKRTG